MITATRMPRALRVAAASHPRHAGGDANPEQQGKRRFGLPGGWRRVVGYANSRTFSTDAYGAALGVDARLSTTDVTTHGSDTQHINTQAAGTLTASTGTNAANGVSVNLGVNIAEGIGNAQSNDVSLAAIRPDWRAYR